MIPLDRSKVKAPGTWAGQVARKLSQDFSDRAKAYELLPLADRKNQSYQAYAPDTLPKKRGKADFPNLWGKAKRALQAMSHDKCAYCEHPIGSNREGQVEHFKPKALFPSLAYEWNNYFLGCGGCNGAKSNKWPDDGEYLRPDEGYDPGQHLQFKEDGQIDAVNGYRDALNTIRDFDLKRDKLVDHRKFHIGLIVTKRVKELVELGATDPARAQKLASEDLALLKDPKNFYSAALTQCFSRAWQKAFPDLPL